MGITEGREQGTPAIQSSRRRRRIGRRLRRRIVDVEPTDLVVGEVAEEFVVSWPHVVGPNDRRVSYVWIIVDPVEVGVVMATVADEDELRTSELSQLSDDARAIEVAARPGRFDRRMADDRDEADGRHRETYEEDATH